ncbi:MAG: DNA polymerase III subunit delta' [Dehalococcoidales bacterium]|jgi:DNA polymerase-3 subunit delta'|nr:DNA polymerase III subunit delta' [Candidatus Omnitrophota bacterium]
MSFSGIIGQDLAVDLLKRAMTEGRLAHAYLFIGPEGTGKSLLARIFAKALNCEKPGPADPCGECVSCRKIEGGIHPDVITVSPEGKSVQIGIDAIRRMEGSMSLKPYEGRTKVFIIDGADRMTEESANSLLKTLEEPPKDTVIVLLASNMFKLQPTIVSRCQKVLFHPLGERPIMKELIERYGLDEKRALCVSRFSEGRLGKAVEVLEGELLEGRNRIVDDFLVPKAAGYEDTWLYAEPREKVNEALNALAVYFRDLLVFSLSKDQGLLVNLDKAADIARDSAKFTADRLENIIDNIAATQDEIKRNANIKIALSCLRLNIT